jgi:deoxyribodipyrimidine photo-lyase
MPVLLTIASIGYMHNRCRMVVASYLSKDLLLDWRRGEKYFMQQLIDGDLAQNNGGWQWSASTGCDPQPFFVRRNFPSLPSRSCSSIPEQRIFNPISQSEKIDPDGNYIRHWVPELKHLKGKGTLLPLLLPSSLLTFFPFTAIHNPSSVLSAGELRKIGYPSPIVDHAKARLKAIEVYKAAAQSGAEK